MSSNQGSSAGRYSQVPTEDQLLDDKSILLHINDGEQDPLTSFSTSSSPLPQTPTQAAEEFLNPFIIAHPNNSDLPPNFDDLIKQDRITYAVIQRFRVIGAVVISSFLFLLVLKISFFPNLFGLFSIGGLANGQTPTHQVEGLHGVVAAENEICSRVGRKMLKVGGSAVDAAIAGGLCIGVLNSFSSGLGGGGFMTIRTGDGTYDFIDFREVAPQATKFEDYLVMPNRTQFGGMAIGVPGELRGFEVAHQRYGKLPWKQLFEPSIRLARDGFKVGKKLAHYLEANEKHMFASESFKQVYTISGKLVKQGDVIYRKNYASTLEKIANSGAQSFYTGEIAESLIKEINSQGGVMTLEDLSKYKAITRPPLIGSFHGHKIITSPAPTSGPILLSILNILEGYTLGHRSRYAKTLEAHRLVEAFKFGYAQRTQLADPEFTDLAHLVSNFTNKQTAHQIRARINDTRTYGYQYYEPKYATKELPGTTHLSIIDQHQMAVGLTTTVNLIFGSKIMVPSTGIILNNQIDDFSIPHTKNGFDLYPSPANYIQPNKRPLSSTVPTIVESTTKRGVGLLVIGGSGGSRILTAAIQVMLQILVNGMELEDAIDTPRLHHQLLPEQIFLEPKFCPDLARSLQFFGHNLTYLPAPNSVIQAAQRTPGGVFYGASDGRKEGKAAAY